MLIYVKNVTASIAFNSYNLAMVLAKEAARPFKDFFTKFPVTKKPSGTILERPNEDIKHVHFVESGLVKVYSIAPNGNKRQVLILHDNDIFPLKSIFGTDDTGLFKETLTPTNLRVAPVNEFVN